MLNFRVDRRITVLRKELSPILRIICWNSRFQLLVNPSLSSLYQRCYLIHTITRFTKQLSLRNSNSNHLLNELNWCHIIVAVCVSSLIVIKDIADVLSSSQKISYFQVQRRNTKDQKVKKTLLIITTFPYHFVIYVNSKYIRC